MVKVKNITNQINDIDFEKMAKQAKQVAQNACQTAKKLVIKSLPYLDAAAKWYLIAILAIPAILLLIAYNVISVLKKHKQDLFYGFIFATGLLLVGAAIWFCLVVVLLFTP